MPPGALRRLHDVAGGIRSAFELRVDDLTGGSIHRFHKNRGNVEQILRGSGRPHSTSFALGAVTVRTRIAAITGERGPLAGYVVVRDVVRDNVSAEARQPKAGGRRRPHWTRPGPGTRPHQVRRPTRPAAAQRPPPRRPPLPGSSRLCDHGRGVLQSVGPAPPGHSRPLPATTDPLARAAFRRQYGRCRYQAYVRSPSRLPGQGHDSGQPGPGDRPAARDDRQGAAC